jgi:hypothetical protein
MNFSERPPSKEWVALKFGGKELAEVWFKPEGDALALVFRIPPSSFRIPGMAEQLTTENLLKAVAIAPEDVESWRLGGVSYSGLNGSNPQLKNPLPQPPQDASHLDIYVHLKPSHLAVVRNEGGEPETASAKWQEIEPRWKAILGLEATIDTLRINTEGLRREMEASFKRMLTGAEKLNALSNDVVQWNKAKSRIHYVLPKANEFIHRAIWSKGTPERKRLDEFFKNPIGVHIPLPEVDRVLEELEILRKDLQALSGKGATVHQECRSIIADVQSALRRLQINAAARPSKERGATGAKSKGFS